MAMTNSERQRRYREKALRDPDGHLLTRVQVMLEPYAAANLERLCRLKGWTRRQAIEEAINELAQALQCNTD
jgi:hypothetical protein